MLDLPPGGFRTLLWERGRGPSRGSWLSTAGAGSWTRAASFGPPGSPGSCLGEALALRSGVSSPSHRSTWSLGLFGCAVGEAAATGDPKMSLVLPPGGFRRGRVCTGPDSSNIPLPFPPAETSRVVSGPEHPSNPATLVTSETSPHGDQS